MAPEICADCTFWKPYNLGRREYNLWRSCKYDPTPGETAPPSEGNLPPCLTVWIFIHKAGSGEGEHEERIGEISILAYRNRWKGIAHLDNEVAADDQLREAAISARNGIWEIEPLTRMLSQGWEEIQKKIHDYENGGAIICGEFLLQ